MGIISKIFGWMFHPINDKNGDIKNWMAGLVVVLIVSFLWTNVLREID